MSGVWKRGYGKGTWAPPDERGGNRHTKPTATAPHLDSTRQRSIRRPTRSGHRPAIGDGHVNAALQAIVRPISYPIAVTQPRGRACGPVLQEPFMPCRIVVADCKRIDMRALQCAAVEAGVG